MDQNILSNIKESLVIMGRISSKLKAYLEIFEMNHNNVLINIKKRNPHVDEIIYHSFINDIPFNKNKVKELIEDISIILDDVKTYDINQVSSQYEIFLTNEIVNYQWNSISYLDDYSVENVKAFVQKLDNSTLILNNEDYNAIDALQNIFQTFNNHFELLQNKILSIKIFERIKNIQGNIVIIGANGSGKSTFARNLKGKFTPTISIISAQHLLIYQKQETVSITNREIMSVHEFQGNDKLGSDPNLIELFRNDFNNLISALFSENNDREHNYYSKKEEWQESVLLKVIKIWNDIIINRKLIPSKYILEVSTNKGVKYDFNYLSDGEKAVFYYIAHVLLTKPNSYIIVDEPENHLHLAICNILWDKLEIERQDCKFVYITHNVDFATSRKNKTILWNKDFTPISNWDFMQLPQDEEIPEPLLMELLGSRKKILFCEGDNKNSLDYKLYTILFSEYTIIPVGGHLSVINYCLAYNKNKSVYGQEAIGIIDGDFHLEEQVRKWYEDKIFTLKTTEVENLLCDETVLKEASVRFLCKKDVIQAFKDKFFKELDKRKEQESVLFANNVMNNFLKSNMLKEKKDIIALNQELELLLNNDVLTTRYNERLSEIEILIKEKDFEKSIALCSFKKGLTRDLANVIVSDFEDRVLYLIEQEATLQETLIKKYFPFMKKAD